MSVQIALLRAVNVGGHKILMADLRAMVSGLGFTDVRTFIQSGNLLVSGGKARGAALEALLEAETAKHFGIETDYLVRDVDEWEALVAANPFTDEARTDPARLVTMPLKAPVTIDALEGLRAVIKGREYVEATGCNAYLVYPDGQGESKLTIKIIERHLGSKGTARNWNTVTKLLALAKE